MYFLLLLVVVGSVTSNKVDVSPEQLLSHKQTASIGILTTSNGAPVEVNDTRTLNSNLIKNAFFMESMAQFVRERIPERVVHAKGAGAFGYFEVTHDISNICKAKLFGSAGKRTPVAVRFSPLAQERGGIDTSRDVRGFAIKFYTEEGNFDLTCLTAPVFAIKDTPFHNFIHALKRNPVTNLVDFNMFWDFATLKLETIPAFFNLFRDGGIPDGYRRMPGFAIHTFQVVNNAGELHFIRFNFLPDFGIENLSTEDGQRLAAVDPDYAVRDLYNAIKDGYFPSWTLSVQVLTVEDAHKAPFNIFDVTKFLPVQKYPLHEVGRLILNRNPNNYFADVEQLAFNPGNLVPGIVGAPDKLFESRLLAYRDALNYRLGANFNKIPVNCPFRVQSSNYLRDGVPPVLDNGGSGPHYYPNSFNGPIPYDDTDRVELINIFEDDSYNFDQVRELYLNEMSEEERVRLVQNIVLTLDQTTPEIQNRVVKLFNLVHFDLGKRIYQGLQMNDTRILEYC